MSFNFFRKIVSIDHSSNLLTVKYKPTNLEQIIGNQEIIKLFKKYLESKNLPNLIVTGPTGVGKKTTIDCLLKQFLAERYPKDALILDGSIDRGKDVVSENITTVKKNNHPESNIIRFLKTRNDNIALKIIVIYDFDHMTMEAQMALRRVIENYASIVRFIFVASDHNNIIEAIQSRSVIIKFNKLDDDDIRKVITNISSESISEDLMELILLSAYGDLKQALIYLQVVLNSNLLSTTEFYKIFNVPYLDEINNLIKVCLNQPSNSIESYQTLYNLLTDGYQAIEILDIFLKVLMLNKIGLSKDKQTYALTKLSECFYQVEQTGSANQLYSLLAKWNEY